SLAPSESVPLTRAFEKKHGIKVELWRAASEKVTQRTITEARARRFSVDAVETIGTDLERMTREKIFAEFHSPHLADLTPTAIPSHRSWFPDRLSYLGVAYNTKLVHREDLPKTYEGFLDPKWQGRLGIEASDVVWLAGILKFWGQDRGMKFFHGLAAMKPDVRTGHTLLTQLVAAGEVPVGLTVYSSGVVAHKRTGAPIDWVPIEPVIGQPLGIGLAKDAPHPHAALLFADFVLSPEGQELFNSLDHRSKLRRHFGLDAEPGLPGGPALIEKHTQAVGGAVAALACRGEERRLERNVDDVGGERALRQLVQCDVEGRLADHAAARGVDHHRRAFQGLVALFPGQGVDRLAELVGNSLCARERAVEEANLLRPFPGQPVAHGARTTAGADHRDGPGVGPPARLLLLDVVDEAVAIVVGAGERPIGPDDHAADRAGASRQR